MKNPFGQIVSFEDYVDIIGIPKEQLNSEEVKNRINKWLVQATEQFDSMISGNGQLGRLYRWFEKLEDNEEDNYKKYKLIKAICSWVETFVIKGKFWVDGLPVINSNVDIQINSSSNDSNVEAKRKDIIQDLVSVGLYQTTNFGDNNTFQDNQQNAEQLIEDLIVLSTSELQQNYLRLNPQKSLEGNLDFANNDLVNGGNIIGSTQHARNNIQYYNIIDSTIDLNKNTILGSLPLNPTQVEAFNQSQQAQDIKIEENKNNIQINTNNIQTNTNNLNTLQNDLNDLDNDLLNIQNKVNAIEPNYLNKNITQLQQVRGMVDFMNNVVLKNNGYVDRVETTAPTSMVNIQHLNNTINPINTKLTSTTDLLNQTIAGLRTLKPFEYVGEYQASTSYKINQLVSYNNNLYLSKEDNNTTTPPSDKWLLVNKETVQVDLSDYYNKLEVDQIKTTLENNITNNTNNINTNTTNITNLQNNVVKLTTDQTINGTKTFNNQIVANAGLTTGTEKTITSCNLELGYGSGTAYITPEDSSNKTLKFGGRSGRGRFNIDLETQTQLMGIKDPTADYHAANKKYVDNLNNQNVKLTGDQSIGGNKTFTQAINVPTPTADTNAATKAYVDNAIQNITPGSGGSIDTSNFATLNTAQTITGAKTFDNQVVIRKDGTPLALRAVNPGKIYMIMKGADDTANFSLGANSSNTSLEVNRGDLTIKTQQANKNIAFENAARIKFNSSVLEMGTEINAGFGGGEVKFIPEDNSTKTLKFYNNQPSDTRRFNLLIPEPTQAQNPATKNYVDTAIAGINTSGNVPQQTLDQINNNTNNITTLQNEVSGQAINIGALQNQVNVNVNRIGTNTNSINNLTNKTNTIEQNYLNKNANTEQVIEGPFTFRRQVSVQSSPLKASDVTNKQYVDNAISQIPNGGYDVIFSNPNTFNNLNVLSPINISSNTTSNKPWIIQFDRKGSNGNKYEGTINYAFILPDINQATFAGNTLWYNSTNKKFENGSMAGITILRTNATTLQLTFQLWEGSNRISNIKLFAPK